MTEPAARGRSRWFDGAAAGCYALWGTIHVLVGSTVLSKAAGPQPHEALRFLADAHPETSPPHFAPATTALAKQHGWNLCGSAEPSPCSPGRSSGSGRARRHGPSL